MVFPKVKFNKGRLARLLSNIPVSSRCFGPPRGYAQDLAALTPSEGEALRVLRPERRVNHPLPRLAAYPDIEAEMRTRFSALRAPAQLLYRLSQARVLGVANAHGVITNADRFILDQHETWGQKITNHPIHYTVKLPVCSHLPGTSFSLISNWSDNYWHWLFDVLGKLILLRDQWPANMSQIDHYLALNLSKYPFKRQSLLHLGYTENQLIDVFDRAQISCDTLLLATRPHENLFPEQDLIDALRRYFLPPDETGDKPRRIYISRKGAANRRIANESDLIFGLQKLGFDCIHLEKLDFLDQVRLFQSATVVLAQHGAGLSNLVFCKPRTKVFELFEPEHVIPCYTLLSEKLSLDYTLLCNGRPERLCDGVWSNLHVPEETIVDVSALIDALAEAL
jgi:hypothetical protein